LVLVGPLADHRAAECADSGGQFSELPNVEHGLAICTGVDY
jgi:hypothetical protein